LRSRTIDWSRRRCGPGSPLWGYPQPRSGEGASRTIDTAGMSWQKKIRPSPRRAGAARSTIQRSDRGDRSRLGPRSGSHRSGRRRSHWIECEHSSTLWASTKPSSLAAAPAATKCSESLGTRAPVGNREPGQHARPVDPLLNQHAQHLPDDVPAPATHRARTQTPMPVRPSVNHKIVSGHGVAAAPLRRSDTQHHHHVGRQLYPTDGRWLGSKTLATLHHRLQP
jgi:hypothetical protein